MRKIVLTAAFLALDGAALAAGGAPLSGTGPERSRTFQFLVPAGAPGWRQRDDRTASAFNGDGFSIVVERSNPLQGSFGTAKEVSFQLTVVEQDPDIIPNLDRIRLLAPCGPSVETRRDGHFRLIRTDDKSNPKAFGIVTVLHGQSPPPGPWALPKGTYSFKLHIGADAARIRYCTLHFSSAFSGQNGGHVPDLPVRRASGAPDSGPIP